MVIFGMYWGKTLTEMRWFRIGLGMWLSDCVKSFHFGRLNNEFLLLTTFQQQVKYTVLFKHKYSKE